MSDETKDFEEQEVRPEEDDERTAAEMAEKDRIFNRIAFPRKLFGKIFTGQSDESSKIGECSDDFYAMINFLKRDLTDQAIAQELRIAGMGRMEHLDGYVQLVKRTREELNRLIEAEGSAEVKSYVGLC